MFKAIVFTFLITVFICGSLFFFYGRTDYQDLRRITDRISTEHGEAELTLSSIRDRVDGLTDTVSRIETRSITITDGSNEADRGVKALGAGLKTASAAVDRIEYRHRETIRIIGSNRDIDFRFRNLIKTLKE